MPTYYPQVISGHLLPIGTPAMGWAESIKWGVKTLAIVHGSVRDNVKKQREEQQKNEEHRQMRR